MNDIPTGTRLRLHRRITHILIVSLAIIVAFMWAAGPVLSQQARRMVPAPVSPSSGAAPHTTPTATFTPIPASTPTASPQANGCWPHHLYIPQFRAPHPATPRPLPTGDVQWSRLVNVVAAHTQPATPIPGAVVEAHDLTYDCCVTDEDGQCMVSVQAHDTHYVSVKASAQGYRPGSIGVPALPTWGSITLSLEPEK